MSTPGDASSSRSAVHQVAAPSNVLLLRVKGSWAKVVPQGGAKLSGVQASLVLVPVTPNHAAV